MVFALRPNGLDSLAQVEKSLARNGQLNNWWRQNKHQMFKKEKKEEFDQDSDKADQDYKEACRLAAQFAATCRRCSNA